MISLLLLVLVAIYWNSLLSASFCSLLFLGGTKIPYFFNWNIFFLKDIWSKLLPLIYKRHIRRHLPLVLFILVLTTHSPLLQLPHLSIASYYQPYEQKQEQEKQIEHQFYRAAMIDFKIASTTVSVFFLGFTASVQQELQCFLSLVPLVHCLMCFLFFNKHTAVYLSSFGT